MDYKQIYQEDMTDFGSTKIAARTAIPTVALANKKTVKNIKSLKAYFSKEGKDSQIKR